MDPLALKVAARYKGKKVTPEGNTVYLYSERQVALRNKKKAERLEKLSKNIHRLRSQVKKDLKSKDQATKLTALAVALIDHTYERVGNEDSADEGHFGVTGWQKSHISFGKGKATIKYVGKSGVKQNKTVTDESVLSALKDAYENCEDGLFSSDGCKVDASKVNKYLKDFDVTAKDLRGYHANREMRDRLKEHRKGALPEDKKDREKQLKKEWKKALEDTAKAVGHEPSTLNSQYLVPGLEDAFLKDGTIPEKMKLAFDEESAALKVVARVVEADRVVLTPSIIEKWQKDLRVITKIYKAVPLDYDDPKSHEMWTEARLLVRRFRDRFEQWVYKFVLPLVKQSEQSFMHREIAKLAWNARHELSMLFPTLSGDTPDFAALRNDRDKNIARYQKWFNAAMKAIAEYLETNSEQARTRHQDEVHHIGDMTVIVEGHGRSEHHEDDLDTHLRALKDLGRDVEQAGFPGATRGLKVIFTFDSKKEGLTNALYRVAEDTMVIFPIGLVGGGRGHGTFYHELGHRFWFKQVQGQAQAHWREVMQETGPKIDADDVERFFQLAVRDIKKIQFAPEAELKAWIASVTSDEFEVAKFRELVRTPVSTWDQRTFDADDYKQRLLKKVGDVAMLDEISEYASEGDPVEQFAEVFRIYVEKGPGAIGPATRALFKTVCRAGGAKLASASERVAERFRALSPR